MFLPRLRRREGQTARLVNIPGYQYADQILIDRLDRKAGIPILLCQRDKALSGLLLAQVGNLLLRRLNFTLGGGFMRDPPLRELYRQITYLEKEVVRVFNTHPEAAWWRSFPGASGPLTPAQLAGLDWR